MTRRKRITTREAALNYFSWAGIILFFTLAVFLVQQSAFNFQASIIPSKQHAPFDGLALPVKNAPNWVALSAEERKMTYSQIPSSKMLPMPRYDAAQLATPVSNLQWGNAAHNVIRNAKITYSVPYMGSYKLDNLENTGSHLAVDVKIPTGTPIYSIGNGVVVKTSTQSSGFGTHIVIRHNDFPGVSGGKETYYSSYSHMSSLSASEGDVVTKGQMIGYSGNTGTSTTPHLHFQIDKDSAPWHPYWPFTFKEAQNSGYSFLEAVNNGLGRERAVAHTINPFVYIQSKGGVSVPAVQPQPTSSVEVEAPVNPVAETSAEQPTSPTPTPVVEVPVVEEDEKAPAISRVMFFHDARYEAGENIAIRIKLLGPDARDLLDPYFNGTISLYLKDPELAQLNKILLRPNNFESGVATVVLTNVKDGTTRLIAEYDGTKFSSEKFEIVKKPEVVEVVEPTAEVEVEVDEIALPVVNLLIEGPTSLKEGESAEFIVSMKDLAQNQLTSFEGVVTLSLSDDLGVLSRKTLNSVDFQTGNAKIVVSNLSKGSLRLLGQYGESRGASQELEVTGVSKPAKAFVIEHDGTFVAGEAEVIVVKAVDEDGAVVTDFDPGKNVGLTVTKGSGVFSPRFIAPELFKGGEAEVMFTSTSEFPAELKVKTGVLIGKSKPLRVGLFADISKNSFAFKAVSYLKEKGVVKGYADGTFKPKQTISRVEVLKMILEALDYDFSSADAELSFTDTSSGQWYAKYVGKAVREEIVKGYPDGSFKPGSAVNYAEFFKMLLEAMEEPIPESFTDEELFADVARDAWFAPYAAFAKKHSLLEGTSFSASKKITREVVADALYKVIQLKKN